MKTITQFISIFTLIFITFSCQHKEIIAPQKATTNTPIPIDPSVDPNEISNSQTNPTLIEDRTINPSLSLSDGTCQLRLQGTWQLSEVLDHEGNSTTCDMIYAHLPNILKFTYDDNIRLDWVDATGFHLLDYTPDMPHECYHAMYKVNCNNRLLTIGNLYCSSPTPAAQRCGPPQYGRFKIIRLSENTVILDSYEAGWSQNNYYPIPQEGVQRFVFERQ